MKKWIYSWALNFILKEHIKWVGGGKGIQLNMNNKNLERASIRGCNFNGADLNNSRFQDTSMEGSSFRSCYMDHTIFSECIIRKSRFDHCRFDLTDIIDGSWREVKFRYVDLRKSQFRMCKYPKFVRGEDENNSDFGLRALKGT